MKQISSSKLHRHVLVLDFIENEITSSKVSMIKLFLSFTCENNSIGKWKVQSDDRYIFVSFSKAEDMIYFKLGKDFDRYKNLWKTDFKAH